MKIVRLYLILLCCFCWRAVSAQEKMTPFRDYRSCTTGFKINKTIIWPAAFDYAYAVTPAHKMNNPNQFWMVSKNGKSGLLDIYGNEIVPCIFDSLVVATDSLFIAIENGKYAGITVGGKLLRPFQQEKINHVRNTRLFTYQSDDKLGILNDKFKTISPAIYTKVEPIYTSYGAPKNIDYNGEGEQKQFSSTIIFVKDSTKYGLVHATRGEIVPPIYLGIEFPELRYLNSDAMLVFLCYSDSTSVIRTSTGNFSLTLLPSERAEFFLYQSEREHPKPLYYAQIFNYTTKRFRLVALNTGKQSNEYQRIDLYGNYFVTNTDNQQTILTSEFNEIYRCKNESFAQPGLMYWRNENESDEMIRDHRRFKRKKKTEEEEEEEPIRPFYFPHGYESDSTISNAYIPLKYDFIFLKTRDKKSTYQILNLKTGKKSGKKYDMIDFYVKNRSVYFWCFNFLNEEDQSELTILNQILEEQRELSVEIGYNRPFYTVRNNARPVSILVKNTAGKFGLIEVDGTDIIPFEYESIQPLITQKADRNFYPPSYLLITKKIIRGERDFYPLQLHDPTGKLVLSKSYTHFTLTVDSILIGHSSGLNDLYTKKLKPILENCSDVRPFPLLTSFNTPRLEVIEKSKTARQIDALYFVEQEHLFCYARDTLHKLNDQFFQFNKDSMVIHGHYIIDRSGKIIGTFQAKQSKSLPPPKQLEIPKSDFSLIKKGDKTFYWKPIYDAKGNSTWYLYDSAQRNKIYSFGFDYPLLNSFRGYEVFAVNGKFGLLGPSFELILPAEYDAVFLESGILVFDNLHWRWYNAKSNTFSDPFDAISLLNYHTGRFVFRNDSIAFIDPDFKYVIPFLSRAQMEKRKDLLNLCRFSAKLYTVDEKNKNFQVVYNLVFERNTQLFASINASYLVDLNYLKNTQESFLELNQNPFFSFPFSGKQPDMYFSRNSNTYSLERQYMVEYNQFFSQRTLTYSEDKSFAQYRRDKPTKELKKITSGTYWIRDGKLKTLTLQNIIKSDPKSLATLKELVFLQLNEKQFKGVNCVDIDQLLRTYQTQFYLSTNGLTLYLFTNFELQEITLSFQTLGNLLDPSLKAHLKKGYYL